jgi:ABC-type nitrate/sulfonate/bicarbonate transport system substrate-binding protein
MRSWRKAAAIIGTLAVLPLQSAAAQQKQTLVRFSFSSGWDALPAIVAIERGFFAQEGLVVSGLAVPSSQAVMESLAAGTTDFAAVPQRTLLVMVAAKAPVKVIAMSGWGTETELVVPKDDTGVKSIADLKGKTIALGVGSEAYPVLIRLLNKAKIRPSEVTIKVLSPADLTRAFQNRLADAVIESRHFTTALLKNGQARVVLSNTDIVEALGLVGAAPLVAQTSLIEKEPATVQKFVNAWVKALKYIDQDRKDAARLLRIFFHRQGTLVSGDLAASWVGMTRYDRYVWSPADVADAEFNGWGLKEGGVLKVLPKLDGVVENRFAQQAVKRLGAGSSPGAAEKEKKAPVK